MQKLHQIVEKKTDTDGVDLSYDDTGTDMVKSNLDSIATKAQMLHDMIGDNDSLPAWVKEKIAVCDEYIDGMHDFLKYEYKSKSATPAK